MRRNLETSEVFIGIDVQRDGRLKVRIWRGGRIDASYSPVAAEVAMRRQLPEAIAEAIEMVQVSSGSSVTLKTSLNANCNNCGPSTGPRFLTL